jgi:glycosyltransferase involved in cell wall biosynthesis
MRIFVVEPYFGGSHAAWAEGYARTSRHEVHLLTLPARFWKWRMQGSSYTLAQQAGELVAAQGQPDLVLASDMLDLPAFLGLTRNVIGRPAVALYMHENQITYPPPPGAPVDHSYGFTNWLSAVAADLILFNSRYHLDEFYSVLPGLLGSLPDFTHVEEIPAVRARSEVLPVGIDLDRRADRHDSSGPPVVLWNQRWEYDKNPRAFFRALYRLIEEGVAFDVILAGENFRNTPEEFVDAEQLLGKRLLHKGFSPPAQYVELLARSDVVVSTAHHEFFGVAVVEAIAAGAFPVLPDRLSYPGLIPMDYHRHCLYGDEEGLVDRLRWALTHRPEAATVGAELAAHMSRFGWQAIAERYDTRFETLEPSTRAGRERLPNRGDPRKT